VQADVNVLPDGVVISVQMKTDGDVPINMANVEFQYNGSQGVMVYPMIQIAPGIYQTEFSRPQPGAYRGAVRYQSPERIGELPVPLAIPYPDEWRPLDVEKGMGVIANWIESTDGRIVEDVELGLPSVPEERMQSSDFLWIFMLVLVLSWPLEIAARRRWLPWL
jgi:hypothetical protein